MIFDFDRPIDRHGTYSKWDMRDITRKYGITQRFDQDTIPLFTADMDFECAPSIKAAIQKVVDRNLYGYTNLDPSVSAPYYQAVTGWFQRRHGWTFDGSAVCYVSGTMDGVGKVIQALTDPGDGVLVTCPTYGSFLNTISSFGRNIVDSHLINHQGYYTFDFDDFERKAANPRTKIFLLCNPQNPVGRVWSPEELKTLYSICRTHGVVIISDELHGDIVRKEQKYTPLMKLVGEDGLVVVTGLGKTFNIAGLNPANFIIADKTLQKRVTAELGMQTPTAFTIAATIGAYTGGDEWVDAVNQYLDENIRSACDFVQREMPEVILRHPEGTYILWMDFRGYGLPAQEISRRITENANVIPTHGTTFDPEQGAGFERFCVPTQRKVLMTALERIAAQF